jgi:uncharacterized repeat protein (TIGR01451 family)
MGTWLGTASRAKNQRKQNRKNRRSGASSRSRFDSLNFQVERLEDRMLLSITTETGSTITPKEGTAFTGAVATFTTDTPTDTFAAIINWGDGHTTNPATVTASGSTLTVSGTNTYADEAADTVLVTLTETGASPDTKTATGTANVSEADTLTAAATPQTLTGTEGATVSGAVAVYGDTYTTNTASDFTAVVNWGDSTTTTITGAGSAGNSITAGGGNLTVTGSHSYVQDGAYTITTTITDDSPGTATQSATATANIAESTLTVTAGAAISTTEGATAATTATTLATFSDPGSNDPATDFTATVNWGDGTSAAANVTGPAGGPFIISPAASHGYKDEGTFTVTVTVSETNAVPTATASATLVATVAEGDTLTASGATISATQGAAFSSTTLATFTDTYTANLPTDFTASINWGDGTTTSGTVGSSAAGTLTVSGSHAYGTTGSHTATVTIADDSPSTVSQSATATINVSAAGTAAPSVSVAKSGPSTASTGAPVTYTVTLTNSSTANAASSVAFTDQLPTGSTAEAFISASDTAGTPFTFNSSTGQVTGTVASIAASGSDTVTIVAVPTAQGSVTDTASISIPSGNSGATQTATATTTVSNSGTPATVAVAVTGPTSAVNAGGKIFYTVTLTNSGSNPATNVAFSDQLDPNEVLFTVSDKLGTPFSVANGVITGTVASIGAGATDTVTIAATPNTAAGTAGSVINTAAIGVPGGNSGAATGGGTDTIGTAGTADVTISKTGPTATSTAVGAPVTYTVTLTNAGATAANNVWIMDPLGTNAAVLSASDTLGSTFNLSTNGNISANVSSLAATGTSGSTDTATIVVVPTLANGAPLANAAYVGVSGGELSTVSNGSAAPNITVTAAPSTAPSLTIAKTASATTVNAGDIVTYTATITNASSTNAATNVQFADSFTDLAILSVSDTAGTSFSVANGVISGTIASIAASGADAITIVASPTAVGTATDPIAVGVPGGNAGTVKANVNNTKVSAAGNTAANVTIAKATAQLAVDVGDALTTTVTLTNKGSSAVPNVAFVDNLPGQAFLSASDTNKTAFALTNGQVTGTIASLAASGTDTITIVSVPTGTPSAVNDTASIAISGGNQAANTASLAAAVPVTPGTSGASVTVKKNVPATAPAGSTVTETITLTNTGANAATNVQFADYLPGISNATASDAASDKFTAVANGITGTIASVPAAGTVTVTVVFTSTTVGTFTDTATIAVPTGNAAAASGFSNTATTNLTGVSVSKSVPGTINVGDVLVDVIAISNSGSTAATNVAFSDTLPTSGYNFVAARDNLGNAFTFSPSTGKLTGTIATLAANSTERVTMWLIPTTAGTLSDTASVTSSGITSTATASSTVSAAPAKTNVSISKSTPKNGTVGDLVSDTVTLTNASTTATTPGAVTLWDVLGPNQSFISASDTSGGSFTFDPVDNLVLGTIGSIAASGTDTVTINVVPTASGTIADTANVAMTGGNSATTLTATGSTTVAPPPTAVKVNVAKTAPSPAVIGSVVTETVTITNAGSSAVTNVSFTDNFTSGDLALVSVSDTAGSTLSFNSNTDTITGTIASLAASGASGAVDTVTVTYIPLTTPGPVTDTASITIAGGNSGTATSTASTTINAAPSTAPSVSIAKASPASAPTGSLLTTTVTLANNTSPAAAATNVAFVDALSPGQTFISASDTLGNKFALTNGSVTGTIATLGTGASNTDTITIVTLVTGASGSTTGDTAAIGVSGGNQLQPYSIQSVTVAPGTANVVVSKSAPATGTVGTAITDTVTLNNKGSAAVTNVSFIDILPGNVSSVTATDAAGDKFTFANGQVTGTIASLATGTSTVNVVYTPTAAGTFGDNALIGIAAGNTGTPSATASTTVSSVPTQADVTISKTGPAIASPGANVTYTITVSDALGAANAAGVVMTDTLPANATFVSATDGSGAALTNNNGVVTDNIGNLAAGASDTITVVVTMPSSGSITDTANVTTTTTNIGTPTTASATTAQQPPPGVGYLSGQPGDGTAQTFVHNLYRELLGREPDSAGQTYWVSYLTAHNNSTGRDAVITGFLNSPEYAIHYITTLYVTLLGRAPDAPGLQFWTQKMGQPGTAGQHGGSADEKYVVAAFVGSDEFYAHAGGTTQGFVNAMYLDLMGRTGDAGGIAYWEGIVNAQPNNRDGIVRSFLGTPEAEHKLLDIFYFTGAAGGTTTNPLPGPGKPAAPLGSSDLAVITGLGWENLYLEGPYGTAPQGNDAFFTDLANGTGWDDLQIAILETGQYYSNPNSPVTD